MSELVIDSKKDTNDDRIVFSREVVDRAISNTHVIGFIKTKLKRLSTVSAKVLIRKLMYFEVPINASYFSNATSFYHYNMGQFDENKNFKMDFVKELRIKLKEFIQNVAEKDLDDYDLEQHQHIIIKDKDKMGFVLDKSSTFNKMRKKLCEEKGKVFFKYDFDKSDLEIKDIEDHDGLQRAMIQIITRGYEFDYAVEFFYHCPECDYDSRELAYAVESTNNKIKCEGIIYSANAEGEVKPKVCRNILKPDYHVSVYKKAYFFYARFLNKDNEDTGQTFKCVSFSEITPGFYDSVFYKLPETNAPSTYMIMDYKREERNHITFPQLDPCENYVFTLQKHFDNYIKEKAGIEIYGLYPIKVALILQKLISELDYELCGNIMTSGDASTGKTTILKYYGYLLHSHSHMSTNGISVSVAGLRGTRDTITIFNKDYKIITKGHLGTHSSIHIDEAGEDKLLIKNLKTFLYDSNYSYNKAGSENQSNKRTAHCNISENLDYNHVGQFRGAIRKAYKENIVKIGNDEKIDWEEEWDLYQPLYKYDNPYLLKVIKEKRSEYQMKQQFWIDGYDYALHERFPFYFYLVDEKRTGKYDGIKFNNALSQIVVDNNVLMTIFENDDMHRFFQSLLEYKYVKLEIEVERKITELLANYGISCDARMKKFFIMLINLSRIINKRHTVEDMDYKLLQWFIEKSNRKLDIEDTDNYDVEGFPDIKKEKEIEKKIEEESRTVNNFGLPEGEF